jgi:uncharacterized low-complexity protein
MLFKKILYTVALMGLSVLLYAQETGSNTAIDKNMTKGQTESIPQSQCGSGKCGMGKSGLSEKMEDGISHGSKCGVSENKCGGVSHGSRCGTGKCSSGN